MKAIAVIPARCGSKRIPRKNIKLFLGRPVISYPIARLKESGLVDRIIVSTDDDEIAEIAVREGAEAPFRRPKHLSDDKTGTGAVIQHAVSWLDENECLPDFVCCVYATAALLDVRYLKIGLESLIESDKKFAFSVTSYPFPIQRAIKLTKGGGVTPFYPEYAKARSQELEPAFHDAGQFYWGRSGAFVDGSKMFSDDAAPVMLPHYMVQDIDTEEDWLTAEREFKNMMRQQKSD